MDARLLKKMSSYVKITKQSNMYVLEKRYSTYKKWCITTKTDSFFAVVRHKHDAWSALLYALGYGHKILERYNR